MLRRACRVSYLSPQLTRALCVGATGPEQTQVPKAARRLLVYEGQFGVKLRWLRRVSLSSAVVSVVGFPVAFQFGVSLESSIPLVGQFMIAGTAIFTSLSSTLFLQAITSPYVVQLYEIVPDNASSSSDRQFEATRTNIFGSLVSSKFSLADVEKANAGSHPFATFKDKKSNNYYYTWKHAITDPTLKEKLGI